MLMWFKLYDGHNFNLQVKILRHFIDDWVPLCHYIKQEANVGPKMKILMLDIEADKLELRQ